MDASRKQLHQAPVFGEDTDVIYLRSCDLNTQFDFTVPSVQFLWLNVVFGQFIFVSSFMLSSSLVQLGTTRNYIAVEEKFLGFVLLMN